MVAVWKRFLRKKSLRLPGLSISGSGLSAVDAAHHLGIVHRDLKPDNIWLEPNRRGGYTVKFLISVWSSWVELPFGRGRSAKIGRIGSSFQQRRALRQ